MEMKSILQQMTLCQEQSAIYQLELEQAKAMLSEAQADIKCLEEKQRQLYDWGYQMSRDLQLCNDQLKASDAKLKQCEKLLKLQKPGRSLSDLAALLELPGDVSIDRLTNSANLLKRDLAEARSALQFSMCLTDFKVGRFALFLKSPHGNFEAFNYRNPLHFLDLESLKDSTEVLVCTKPYIVGEIIRRRNIIASDEYNPYNLSPGTEFTVLSIKEAGL